jgi:hypothetical protein
MDIESKARGRVIADSIASLSNVAIDVQGQRKIVIYGRSKYVSKSKERVSIGARSG